MCGRGPGTGVQRLGTQWPRNLHLKPVLPWLLALPHQATRAGGSRLRGQAQSQVHSCGADLREAEAVLRPVSSPFWAFAHLSFCVCLARVGSLARVSVSTFPRISRALPIPSASALLLPPSSLCAGFAEGGERRERRTRGGSGRKVGIGAGQEGGEKRGREERAARWRRGGREPRSAAPAPASGASRAAARRGPSRDGLARGLRLLLPRPAAPPPRRAPPAGEWPRGAGGRRPVRHGCGGGGQCRGRSPGGAGPRGRGARGWRLRAGGPRSRGSRRAQTAGSQEGDQGAGRGPRSNSGRGRHAFARPGAHTPGDPARPGPAPHPRAPHRRRSWIAVGHAPPLAGRDRPGLASLVYVTSGKLRQKAGLEEADFTFQPHSWPPCAATQFCRPPGHTPSAAFLPLPPCASPPLRGGQAPSLSSNHSYFQEGGVWVEGFLQTNPRLQSAMGARLGEKPTGSGMFQAGEGSWGLAMPSQACPKEPLSSPHG